MPQARHRIFIVGIRRGLRRRFLSPSPTTGGTPVTAREALERPFLGSVWNAEEPQVSAVNVERLKYIQPGETLWDAQAKPGFPDHLRLDVAPEHQFRGLYRRLNPDRPTWTIVARGGGGSKGYHWYENRSLNNRERARLQGFPDDFRFLGGFGSIRSQVGMAVPPPAGKVICEALLKTLAGIRYDSVSTNLLRKREAPPLGRPRRLEAKSDARRAQLYRRRRVTEKELLVTVLERAARAGMTAPLSLEDQIVLARFIKRSTGWDMPVVSPAEAAE